MPLTATTMYCLPLINKSSANRSAWQAWSLPDVCSGGLVVGAQQRHPLTPLRSCAAPISGNQQGPGGERAMNVRPGCPSRKVEALECRWFLMSSGVELCGFCQIRSPVFIS